jgi:acyl-[acyl-carrier-protein]-phospholipid O-acyltransferase/long-chain-fatty-acid--[acyl-carrier-protein] ligase
MTAEVLNNGWYTTGDVAMVDEDGFVAITDRLSRFSKIGGEMVPHLRIEEKLHDLAGSAEQVFSVTSLPDEKKGERIAVLTTLSDEALAPVLEKLSQCDLPALWKPKANLFFHTDKLPILGTGKTDLRGVRELASSLTLQAGV